MSDANDLLLDTYARVGESVPDVLDGLSTEEAAWRPDVEANSVGWLVWHLTRVLDDHVADLQGSEQVLTERGYDDRLGLDLAVGDTGYGHDPATVDRVRFADLSVLADYHRDVQAMVSEYLREVTDFGRVVDERWDPPVTLGARLVSVGDDMARHVGQAQYLRGLLERHG